MSKEVKIAVLGAGGVGKSSTVVQFVIEQFVTQYDPTIEDSYRKTTQFQGETIVLDILDTAGPEEYSAMRDLYIRNSVGFIVMYSITSRWSFEEVRPIIDQIYRSKDMDSCPIVLVGNKIDEDDREVTFEEGVIFSKNYEQMIFFEASAKERINTDEIFFAITELCLKSGTLVVDKKHTQKENCVVM